MGTLQQRFEVERPVAAVYEALEQPQSILQTLPGVTGVRRAGDDLYRIALGPVHAPREVELQLTAKMPPRQIEWRTTDDVWSGAIALEPLGAERTAVAITAEGESPPSYSASAVHEVVLALERALQSERVRVYAGRGGAGSAPAGGGARRYASEWRETAQSALTRPAEFPLRLMRTISQQMERVWGDVLRGTPISRLPQMMPGLPWNPDVEVCEEDNQVRVCIDVPGVDESHLQVDIDEGAVTVRGERQDERGRDGGHRRSEFHYGSFSRRIPLPDGVDADGARAMLRNGVLEIRIPMHRREPRRVPVQHAPQ